MLNYYTKITLRHDGRLSKNSIISVSPTSALIVLHPCDCRAEVRMLGGCCIHKGNIWAWIILSLPSARSELILLLWLNDAHYSTIERVQTNIITIFSLLTVSHVNCKPRTEPPNWAPESACAVCIVRLMVCRFVCVWAPGKPISCTSLCVLVQLEVLQCDRRGLGILLKIVVINMSTNKVKKVKMATKSCPECDQQVRCFFENEWYIYLCFC